MTSPRSHAATGAHPLEAELIALNQRLLDSIVSADWKTYDELCDPTISAFEPEARGRLVEGMPFHKFYFALGKPKVVPQATMVTPHVRLLGEDAAVLSYVRLVQKLDEAGSPVTTVSEETRVWQRREGQWRHVHFHRSNNP
jgi:Calcium/calmodulin dependent protein kinase II association domain